MPFAPTDIAGCKLWLDASGLSAGALGTWTDGSSAGNTVSQATAGAKPTVVAGGLNGLPVVRFDGSDDTLSAAGFTGIAAGYSLFAVVVPQATPDAYDALVASDDCWVMLAVGGTGGWGLYTSGDQPASAVLSAGTAYLLEVVTGGTGANYYSSGVADGTASGPTNNSGISGFNVGSQGSIRFSQVDVGEIVVYDSALGTTDRQSVENYLLAKWFGVGGGGSSAGADAMHHYLRNVARAG